MSTQGIALRYAKALFSLSEEKGVVDAVRTDMETLSHLTKSSRALVLFLRNPVITAHRKREIARLMWTDKVQELTLRFVLLLFSKRREALLSEIAQTYLRLYWQHKGIVEAVLSTPYALSKTIQAQFSKRIERLLNKEVRLTYQVLPGALGGYVLQVGDKQLDKSVATQLAQIRDRLTK